MAELILDDFDGLKAMRLEDLERILTNSDIFESLMGSGGILMEILMRSCWDIMMRF